MKTKIISVILIVLLIVNCSQIYAVTKSELNNQQNNLDNQISQKKDEIDEKNSEISESMKEVQTLTAQIGTYEQAISDLKIQITTISGQIDEAEKDIKAKEQTLKEKQEMLDKRLIALYEGGNTSYIDLLLSSADLTDFISKYYLISELATYDTELITSIRMAKQAVEDSKVALENNKTALETAKAEQEQKQNELAVAKKAKEAKVSQLSAEEKLLEQELAAFEADKKRIQNELAEIARKEEEERKRKEEESRKNGSSSSITNITSSPSSSGYIFPVAGCSRSSIRNTSYPSYAGHTGVDVNIGVSGKSVVAVKAGTVEISTARKTSSGTYYSYGEYVVVNHHDGTMTLYAHMKAGSRQVRKNQEVSQGQVLGTVGNTGNVLPRPTASNPTAGTHLHFEVLVKGRPVNPMLYLP